MREMLSAKAQGMQPSPTVSMSDKAKRMRGEGIEVIDISAGQPDFATPQHIVDAGMKGLRDGFTHYTLSRGIKPLREAIARKLLVDNDLKINPDTEIIVTPGAKFALHISMMACIDPGDEVLILDPSWVSYEPIVQMAGGGPVHVYLRKEDGFRVAASLLEEKLSRRTKGIIVNSPNNPTGRVLTSEELNVIANIAKENDLLVFSDEIYEKIIFDKREHISIGSLPSMKERTLTCNGFSKTYAMTGWRLGYVAGDESLIDGVLKIHQHSVACVTSFAALGAVAALEGPQQRVLDMIREYDAKRNLVIEGINAIPGVSCWAPEGTFYAFPDISGTGLNSTEAAKFLLEKAHVVTVPGSAFGEAGEGHLRLSFATSQENIRAALDRIKKAFR